MTTTRRVSESDPIDPLQIYTLLAKSEARGIDLSQDEIQAGYESGSTVNQLITSKLPQPEIVVENHREFNLAHVRSTLGAKQ